MFLQNINSKIKSLFKKKSKGDLFLEAGYMLRKHFKNEFGNDITFHISVINADYKDELLKGDCKSLNAFENETDKMFLVAGFIHFKKD